VTSADLTFTVTDDDTAVAVGSGSLPVLGTPRLLTWAEAATCAAVEAELPSGSTSVGTQVSLEHKAASAVGEQVRVTATVVRRDGRQLDFEVVAVDSTDQVVGQGRITRVVVDGERFMARLAD
jgi:fluoroacetyl-CoA thioesterase